MSVVSRRFIGEHANHHRESHEAAGRACNATKKTNPGKKQRFIRPTWLKANRNCLRMPSLMRLRLML